MELTSAAAWLNTTFGAFDYSILAFLHGLAESVGMVLTPLFSFISLIGEQGACMFVLAIVLMIFKKTRKIGLCIFVAVGWGALITSFTVKDIVARPRPFEDVEAVYNAWWIFVGSPEETGFSFPSGHVTAVMAGMTALFLTTNKKVSWLGFLFVLLMGMSRNYLMVHYPSDVLGAIVVGVIAALLALSTVSLILRFVERKNYRLYAKFFPTGSEDDDRKISSAKHARLT